MRLRFPYFYQLMGGFLIVIMTLIVVTSTSFYYFGRNQLLNNLEESFFNYAELIEDVARHPEDLEVYNHILRNQQVEYAIFNRDGEMIYPRNQERIHVSIGEEELSQLTEGNSLLLRSQTADLRGNDVETAIIYTPLMGENGQYEGFIGIGRPVSHLGGQMEDLKDNITRAFLISTVAAIILSVLFSYFLVKRVNRLSKASQKVAEGDYDIYIDHSNRDEIDRLSADFNKMIKALKEWRKEVLHLEERRKTFMQDVAHEMRTPLTTINGLLEGMEYGVFDKEQEMRSIKLMRKETTRLVRLVNENLDYENIQSNRIVLRKNQFPVIEAIEEVREQLKNIADDSNNIITLDDHIEDITIYADYDRFKQIIVNLLKNALQFTTNGEINIKAFQDKQATILIVSDNGLGMTFDEMSNIWDRYYKADPSRKNTKYGESGLGLPIVKQLVELHDGEIIVESEPNKGTTFTIEFPRTKIQ